MDDRARKSVSFGSLPKALLDTIVNEWHCTDDCLRFSRSMGGFAAAAFLAGFRTPLVLGCGHLLCHDCKSVAKSITIAHQCTQLHTGTGLVCFVDYAPKALDESPPASFVHVYLEALRLPTLPCYSCALPDGPAKRVPPSLMLTCAACFEAATTYEARGNPEYRRFSHASCGPCAIRPGAPHHRHPKQLRALTQLPGTSVHRRAIEKQLLLPTATYWQATMVDATSMPRALLEKALRCGKCDLEFRDGVRAFPVMLACGCMTCDSCEVLIGAAGGVCPIECATKHTQLTDGPKRRPAGLHHAMTRDLAAYTACIVCRQFYESAHVQPHTIPPAYTKQCKYLTCLWCRFLVVPAKHPHVCM